MVVAALVSVALPWALYTLAFQRGGEELSVLTPLLIFATLLVVRHRGAAPGAVALAPASLPG